MELKELKEFMRVDSNEEDGQIESLKLSAELYLKNAGVKVSYENELYALAVKLLTLHWYDNRSCIGESNKKVADISLTAIINQLIYTPQERIKDESREKE